MTGCQSSDIFIRWRSRKTANIGQSKKSKGCEMGEIEENGSLTRRGRGEDKHNNEKRGGANPRLEMKRQRHASPPRCHYRAICVRYSSMPTPHLKKRTVPTKIPILPPSLLPHYAGLQGRRGFIYGRRRRNVAARMRLKKRRRRSRGTEEGGKKRIMKKRRLCYRRTAAADAGNDGWT